MSFFLSKLILRFQHSNVSHSALCAYAFRMHKITCFGNSIKNEENAPSQILHKAQLKYSFTGNSTKNSIVLDANLKIVIAS